MTFGEAIRIVLFKKYANFSGRARRAEYWWFFLFCFVLDFGTSRLTSIIAEVLPFSHFDAVIFKVIISTIILLYLFIPSLSVEVRRLHDRNMSGIWAIAWGSLLTFVLLLNFVILFFYNKFFEFMNKFFEFMSHIIEEKNLNTLNDFFIIMATYFFVATIILLVLVLIWLVILIILMFKGTKGPNKYGPDPLTSVVDTNVFK